MKRIIAIMLSVLMILSVTSCVKYTIKVNDVAPDNEKPSSNIFETKDSSSEGKAAVPSKTLATANNSQFDPEIQKIVDAYNEMTKDRLGTESEGYYENGKFVYGMPTIKTSGYCAVMPTTYSVYETLEDIYMTSNFVATAKVVKIDTVKIETENGTYSGKTFYRFYVDPICIYKGEKEKKELAGMFLKSSYDYDSKIPRLDVGDTLLLFLKKHEKKELEDIYQAGSTNEIDARLFSSFRQNFVIDKNGKLKMPQDLFEESKTIEQAQQKLIDMMKNGLKNGH